MHLSKRGLILCSDKGFFSSPKYPDRLWDISPGQKWSERKFTYSRPSVSEVKIDRGRISAFPQACMALTGKILNLV